MVPEISKGYHWLKYVTKLGKLQDCGSADCVVVFEGGELLVLVVLEMNHDCCRWKYATNSCEL